MAWFRLVSWLSSFIRAESSAPGAPRPQVGGCISSGAPGWLIGADWPLRCVLQVLQTSDRVEGRG